jgi:hypothetical protein
LSLTPEVLHSSTTDMPAENNARAPFDDHAALEELERLQRSIQEYRRKREQAEGEFEEFVGGFRADRSQPALAPPPSAPVIDPAQPSHAASAHRAATIPVAAAVVPTAIPPAEPIARASGPPPAVAVPPGFFSEAPRAVTYDGSSDDSAAPVGMPRSRLPFILAAGGVLLVAAVLFSRSTSAPASAPPSAPAPTPLEAPAADPPRVEAPAAGAPAVSSAPASHAPPPAAAAPAPPAEIRTVRRVWVRVLTDGNRTIEREVQANAIIPLPAARTFVVRAGDAGAVHFYLNGQDQGPLGADAQVVTRTFTSGTRPAPAPR